MTTAVRVTDLWATLDAIEALRGKCPPPTPKVMHPSPVTPETVNRVIGFVRAIHKRGIQLPDQVVSIHNGAVQLEWCDSRDRLMVSVRIHQSGATRCTIKGHLSATAADAMWSLMAATNLLRVPLHQGAPPLSDEDS